MSAPATPPVTPPTFCPVLRRPPELAEERIVRHRRGPEGDIGICRSHLRAVTQLRDRLGDALPGLGLSSWKRCRPSVRAADVSAAARTAARSDAGTTLEHNHHPLGRAPRRVVRARRRGSSNSKTKRRDRSSARNASPSRHTEVLPKARWVRGSPSRPGGPRSDITLTGDNQPAQPSTHGAGGSSLPWRAAESGFGCYPRAPPERLR